jgi:DNA polymerase V
MKLDDKERNVLGMRFKLEGKSVLDLEPITPKKEHCYYQKFPKQIAEFDLLRESVATLQRNAEKLQAKIIHHNSHASCRQTQHTNI